MSEEENVAKRTEMSGERNGVVSGDHRNGLKRGATGARSADRQKLWTYWSCLMLYDKKQFE